MKKIQALVILLAIMLVGFSSCSKDDKPISGTPTSSIIIQGIWKISFFSDNGNNETSNYAGYTFTFNANGSVSAIVGSVVTNGTWTTYNDDSQNKLVLDLGTTPPLDELKKDWQITEKTNVKIVMVHVSGGGGGTDYLTIEKL